MKKGNIACHKSEASKKHVLREGGEQEARTARGTPREPGRIILYYRLYFLRFILVAILEKMSLFIHHF